MRKFVYLFIGLLLFSVFSSAIPHDKPVRIKEYLGVRVDPSVFFYNHTISNDKVFVSKDEFELSVSPHTVYGPIGPFTQTMTVENLLNQNKDVFVGVCFDAPVREIHFDRIGYLDNGYQSFHVCSENYVASNGVFTCLDDDFSNEFESFEFVLDEFNETKVYFYWWQSTIDRVLFNEDQFFEEYQLGDVFCYLGYESVNIPSGGEVSYEVTYSPNESDFSGKYDVLAWEGKSWDCLFDGSCKKTFLLDPWWYGNFYFRDLFRVQENFCNGSLYDFQVNFTFSKSPNMSSGLEDLRYTWLNKSSGLEQAIDHWVERNGVSDFDVWVEVPFIDNCSNESIYQYYGNEDASDVSNPYNVFDLYDGFSGTTLNTSIWTLVGNLGVGVSGSIITMTPNVANSQGAIKSVKTFQNNYALEMNGTKTQPLACSTFGGISCGSDFGFNSKMIVPLNYNVFPYNFTGIYDHSSFLHYLLSSDSTGYTSSLSPQISGYHLFRIIRLTNQTSFFRDSTNMSPNPLFEDVRPAVSIYYTSRKTNIAFSNQMDWVRVRKSIYSNPTVLFVENESVFSYDGHTIFFNEEVFEEDQQSINLSVNGSFFVNVSEFPGLNVSAVLFYGGDVFTGTFNSSSNGSFFFSRIYNIPSVEDNNTKIELYWNYSVDLGNGSVLNFSTVTFNQSIYHSFFIKEVFNPTFTYEGKEFIVYSNISKLVDRDILSMKVLFNDTFFDSERIFQNSTLDTYKTTIYSGQIDVSPSVLNITYILLINSVNRSEISNVTVYQINVSVNGYGVGFPCPVGFVEALIFTVFDEGDLSLPIVFESEISGTIFNKYVSRLFSIAHTQFEEEQKLCISPEFSEFNTSFEMFFRSDAVPPLYGERTFIHSGTLNNISQPIKLYLPNLDDSEIWTVSITENSEPSVGYVVRALRFYPELGTTLEVASETTNPSGEVNFVLYPLNVKYGFSVELNGVQVFFQEPAKLTQEDKRIELEIGSVIEYPASSIGRVLGVCQNPTLEEIRCNFFDGSSLTSGFSLEVTFRNFLNGSLDVCRFSSSSNTGIFVCSNLSSINASGFFHYILEADLRDGTSLVLDSGSLTAKPSQSPYLGILALLIIFIFSIVGYLSADFSPTGIVIGLVCSLFFVSFFNMLYIPAWEYFSFILILVVILNNRL